MEKITKRTNITNLLAMAEVQANPDAVAYLKNELDLLDKKNAKRKTELTETQKENVEYQKNILATLTEKAKAMSCSELAKIFGLSTQRVTPMLKKLVEDGDITVETVKRTNYYKSRLI